VRFIELFVPNKKLFETIEPRVRRFNNPSTSLELRVVFLFFYFFPTLLYVGDIVSLFDSFYGWDAGIAFICAKVLFYRLGALDNDLVQYDLKLADIMPVRPGYDNR
jgi:hypothetical protein